MIRLEPRRAQPSLSTHRAHRRIAHGHPSIRRTALKHRRPALAIRQYANTPISSWPERGASFHARSAPSPKSWKARSACRRAPHKRRRTMAVARRRMPQFLRTVAAMRRVAIDRRAGFLLGESAAAPGCPTLRRHAQRPFEELVRPDRCRFRFTPPSPSTRFGIAVRFRSPPYTLCANYFKPVVSFFSLSASRRSLPRQHQPPPPLRPLRPPVLG